jgi:hypothetical protein
MVWERFPDDELATEIAARKAFNVEETATYVIRFKRIYNFLCSMLVYTPFALCFVTLRDILCIFWN